MEGSEYIIAVNKDKGAPIFQVADIGVVADLNQLLPVLNKLIKKEKE
jgi:electron transfer flavoprotein alpha subunit